MEEDRRDFATFAATTHRIVMSVQAAGWPPRGRRPSYALLEEAYTVCESGPQEAVHLSREWSTWGGPFVSPEVAALSMQPCFFGCRGAFSTVRSMLLECEKTLLAKLSVCSCASLCDLNVFQRSIKELASSTSALLLGARHSCPSIRVGFNSSLKTGTAWV